MPCTSMRARGVVHAHGIKNPGCCANWYPSEVHLMSSHHKLGPNVCSDSATKQVRKFIIKAPTLDITWGGDSRYWRILDSNVELLQVSWLEVTGSLDLKRLERNQDYKVSFRVKLKADAFGWDGSPVYLMAKAGKRGAYIWKKVDLSKLKSGVSTEIPTNDSILRFRVPNDAAADDKLKFGMYEIWKGRWKGGLVIEEVVIEPC